MVGEGVGSVHARGRSGSGAKLTTFVPGRNVGTAVGAVLGGGPLLHTIPVGGGPFVPVEAPDAPVEAEPYVPVDAEPDVPVEAEPDVPVEGPGALPQREATSPVVQPADCRSCLWDLAHWTHASPVTVPQSFTSADLQSARADITRQQPSAIIERQND